MPLSFPVPATGAAQTSASSSPATSFRIRNTSLWFLQPDLVGDGLERLDEKGDVLGQRAADGLGAAVDVGAVDRAGEGLVLELLCHRLDRQVLDLLRRPDLHARADEADQFVAGVDGLLERR